MRSVLGEVQSLVMLLCGVMVVVSLFMPWFSATLFDFFGIRMTFNATGWEIINNDLDWISPAGPSFVFIGGLLMILCALLAFILPRVMDGSDEWMVLVGKAARVVPLVALFGVVFYWFDARNIGYCDTVPTDWIGYAVWVVPPFAILGVVFGVTIVPSLSGYGKATGIPAAGNVGPAMPRASVRRELLEGKGESESASGRAVDAGKAKEYYDMASDFAAKGQMEQAIACYTDAIHVDPEYALAYFYRGSLLAEKGEVAEALADFEKVKAVSSDPDLVGIAQKRIERLRES